MASWLWNPGRLNWWIGVIFALGAFLFASACVLSLAPSLAPVLGSSATQVPPRELSWWVTFIKLLGCLGFMVAAMLSVVLPGSTTEARLTLSLVFTLEGAVCFLIGSLLMLPETAGGHPASD